MPAATDLRSYLRSKPALHRGLEAVRARYEQAGSLNVSVKLETPDEIAAFRLLGCHKVNSGRLRLQELDAALRASRFEVGLVDALGQYFGRSPQTRAEAAAEEDRQWAEFISDLLGPDVGQDRARQWVGQDERYIRLEWQSGDAEVLRGLRTAVRAVRSIAPDSDGMPLSTFANEFAGGTHELDVGTAARRFFERALLVTLPEAGVEAPLTAETRGILLAAAGLYTDEVSSDVLVANPIGDHPLLHALGQTGLPVKLPLMTVREIAQIGARFDTVFAVENPTVFRVILRQLEGVEVSFRPTVVCTSGQLSVAARMLLARFVDSGATIRYSGDFDAAGLSIARSLARGFGNAVALWRYDTQSYASALRDGAVGVSASRLQPSMGDLPDLSLAISERGGAFQEAIADLLAEDVVCFAAQMCPNPVREEADAHHWGRGGWGLE